MSEKRMHVIVPDIGGRRYKLLRWLIPNSSRVERGCAMYTLESIREKAVTEDEVVSSYSGVISQVVAEGESVNAGDVVAEIQIVE